MKFGSTVSFEGVIYIHMGREDRRPWNGDILLLPVTWLKTQGKKPRITEYELGAVATRVHDNSSSSSTLMEVKDTSYEVDPETIWYFWEK
jgi:hypothetical protein